jgi:hypothetical protein
VIVYFHVPVGTPDSVHVTAATVPLHPASTVCTALVIAS